MLAHSWSFFGSVLNTDRSGLIVKLVITDSGPAKASVAERPICAPACTATKGARLFMNYRLYIIGEEGQIEHRVGLEADNHPGAIEKAQHFLDDKDLELW